MVNLFRKKINKEVAERLPSLIKYPWLSLFDENFYLLKNSDVLESDMDPLQHYFLHGAKEGRDPCEFFSTNWYLNKYPDVLKSGINPLSHYLNHGAKEGRVPRKLPEIEEFLAPYNVFFRNITDTISSINLIQNLISYEKPKDPLVSIVIPFIDNIPFTLQCIYSIFKEFSFAFDIEIIVIDDFSSRECEAILGKVSNITYIRNKRNVGFIESCNKGAEVASGKYLCFLNNDTIVMPGWLEELVDSFVAFPKAGLIGSKLIYPNGLLQEAGGIVFNDGNAANYGKGKDPQDCIFNYARQVDYCSGASIIISSEIFNELGGFDLLYAPAYYEDTDLSLRLIKAGHQVIYQPLSRVIHFEGISCGRDLNFGIKVNQKINRQKFVERWRVELNHYSPCIEDLDTAKDRHSLFRVLYLDLNVPTPDQDSGSIDSFNNMLLLREMGFQVTFIATSQLTYVKNYTALLQKNGIEVIYSPYCNSIKEHFHQFGARYNLIYVCRPSVGEIVMPFIKQYCVSAKVIYSTVDIHSLRLERQSALEKSEEVYKNSQNIKKIEFSLMNLSDIVTVLSEYEYDLLKTNNCFGSKIRLLPFVRQGLLTPNSYSRRFDILFVGNFNHSPNIDAAKFLIFEIMPLLRLTTNKINLILAGSNTPKNIYDLASNDIQILGFVKDLNPLLNKARLLVAPLRYGAGIKGKVALAMMAGLPIVASYFAVEGTKIKHLQECLIADSAPNFVKSILQLYDDEKLWTEIRGRAHSFANRQYGFDTGLKNLKKIIEELGFNVY